MCPFLTGQVSLHVKGHFQLRYLLAAEYSTSFLLALCASGNQNVAFVVTGMHCSIILVIVTVASSWRIADRLRHRPGSTRCFRLLFWNLEIEIILIGSVRFFSVVQLNSTVRRTWLSSSMRFSLPVVTSVPIIYLLSIGGHFDRNCQFEQV